MATIKQLHKNAQIAINRGDYQRSFHLCRDILQQDPSHNDAWFLLSVIYAAKGGLPQALDCVDKALASDADNAEYLTHKARYLCMLGRDEQAVSAADQASTCSSLRALELDTLGVVYTKVGEHEKALAAMDKAISLQANNPQFHFNRASSQQFLGKLEQAKASFEQAITLKPDFYRAHWALSELLKNSAETSYLPRLTELMSAQRLSAEDELYLCHAIAREYEHQQQPKEMFEYLKRGKQRWLKKINYTFKADKQLFDSLKNTITTEAVDCVSHGETEKQPIFIVGMPRSGTTLMERILDSHNEVISLGELHNLGIAVKEASNTRSAQVLAPEVINAFNNTDFAQVSSRYLSSTRFLRKHHQRFVDKQPLNFFYIAHILMAFPNAKIICMRRNPLDTCLSNYKQLFAIDFALYNYSHDLLDTGRYYLQFDQLMAHWQRLFGERILQVDYERLVDSPVETVKTVLAYCRLPWQASCMDFYKTKTAVSTASASQVRQPIYSSAVQRWKRYQHQLVPLVELFEKHQICYSID